MGCNASSTRVYSGRSRGENAIDRFMSRDCCDNSGGCFKHLDSAEEFRQKHAHDALGLVDIDDSKVLHGYLELRRLFDEPMCLEYLRKFADTCEKTALLLFWFEVKEIRDESSTYTQLRACENVSLTLLDGADKPVRVHLPLAEADLTELFVILRSSSWADAVRAARDAPHSRPGRGSGSAAAAEGALALLVKFQRVCFDSLYSDLFKPFKLTSEFRQMCLVLEKRYNQVQASDFDYFDKLGEGAFGVVLSARKHSTGEVFAMKIQRKKELLEHHDVRPQSVTDERVAHSILNHPFIVEVSYAFQTPSLVFMAMTLCPNGDMFSLLQAMPNKMLPHDHVQFYAAEILSALCYIHQQGLIYRDLKLENILLSQDGHVKLADFGAVTFVVPQAPVDQRPSSPATMAAPSTLAFDSYMPGETDSLSRGAPVTLADSPSKGPATHTFSAAELAVDFSSINTVSYNSPPVSRSKSVETRCAPIFSPVDEFSTRGGLPAADLSEHYTPCPAESSSSKKLQNNPALAPVEHRPRTRSVTGTIEYMSPEMMFICQKPFKANRGYTNAVDYWCLGTIIHLLYTGRFPFRSRGNADCPASFPEESDSPADEQLHFMNTYYGALKLDRGIFSSQAKWGDDARALVGGLLTFDPSMRLGSGQGAGYEIMSHPYFAPIDWQKLYRKQVLPPSLHYSIKKSSKSILTATGLTGMSFTSTHYSGGLSSVLSPSGSGDNSASFSLGRSPPIPEEDPTPSRPAFPIPQHQAQVQKPPRSPLMESIYRSLDNVSRRRAGGEGAGSVPRQTTLQSSGADAGVEGERLQPSATSLEQVLMRSGVMRNWIHNGGVCSADDFKFFRQWNFVSPRAIAVEGDKVHAVGFHDPHLV
jgi:serine/threonine protein kinase